MNEDLASPRRRGHGAAPRNGDAPGFRAIRWNIDWILRPLFGIVMAILAIGSVFALAPRVFAGLIVLLMIPASR